MIPVYIVDLGQCDPKKCSGKRMEKFGLGSEVPPSKVPQGSVILSATAEKYLSPADIKRQKRGITVLDFTWSNIEKEPHIRGGIQRKLPYLVASNQINWGKPWFLNSAEAVFAQLIILGLDEQADLFKERFNWVPSFLKINGFLLEKYKKCQTSEEIEAIQTEYLESIASSEKNE